jgi:hypothetical protein
VERARRLTLAALTVAAVGVLGACTSTPSAKAVAKDVVQSIGLPADQQECMLGVIDSMSESEIEDLGEANVGQAIEGVDDGTPELQAFMAELADCRGESGATE